MKRHGGQALSKIRAVAASDTREIVGVGSNDIDCAEQSGLRLELRSLASRLANLNTIAWIGGVRRPAIRFAEIEPRHVDCRPPSWRFELAAGFPLFTALWSVRIVIEVDTGDRRKDSV